MKLLGIGVDVVETARIERSLEKFGDRFLRRVFTEGEIAYCSPLPFPARHLAARFAAKELVSKAFGTGIGRQMGWRDIEVCRRESGEPFILLHGGARELAGRRGVTATFVSLSHSDHYSVANAVLVCGEADARRLKTIAAARPRHYFPHLRAVSSVVERLLHTQEVAGSNPAPRTTFFMHRLGTGRCGDVMEAAERRLSPP